jgi:predicted transcriptional regulator
MDERDVTETLLVKEDPDFVEELSEYLDVLSSSARLKILKLIEKKPCDARTISHDIQTSYENTKKHLDKLLSIGVIKKEAGLGKQTSKGVHPVWEYSLVPGSLEAIVRNLGLFGNMKITMIDRDLGDKIRSVRGKISRELAAVSPTISIMGGPDDGKILILKGDRIRVGRADPENQEGYEEGRDVVLSEEYKAVTRISKPHGIITGINGKWQYEDCGSTGGTYINNRRLEEKKKTALHDGDVLELSKGLQGARLLFTLPPDGPAEDAARDAVGSGTPEKDHSSTKGN